MPEKPEKKFIPIEEKGKKEEIPVEVRYPEIEEVLDWITKTWESKERKEKREKEIKDYIKKECFELDGKQKKLLKVFSDVLEDFTSFKEKDIKSILDQLGEVKRNIEDTRFKYENILKEEEYQSAAKLLEDTNEIATRSIMSPPEKLNINDFWQSLGGITKKVYLDSLPYFERNYDRHTDEIIKIFRGEKEKEPWEK